MTLGAVMKTKFEGPSRNPHCFRASLQLCVPWFEIIRSAHFLDEQIAATGDNVAGVVGLGERVDQGSHPHVAELLMAGHLSNEQYGPTYGLAVAHDLQPFEAGVLRRVEDLQGRSIAQGNQRIMVFALLPNVVAPVGELADQFAGYAGGMTVFADDSMNRPDAEPSEAAAPEKIGRSSPPGRLSKDLDIAKEDVGPHDAEPEGHQRRPPTCQHEEFDDGHVVAPAAETEQVRLPTQGVQIQTQRDVDEAAVGDTLGDRQLVIGHAERSPLDQNVWCLRM